MNKTNMTKEELLPKIRARLKELLVSHLALEDIEPGQIGDDEAIFGEEGLGLDSLDAVEIVVLLQRNFGLTIKETEKGKEVFRTINTLADFIADSAPNPLGDATPGAKDTAA